jgi:ATP diphosphatase
LRILEGVSGIERLLEIMARLRDREGGCPWDLEQDFSSIAPHTIEEAYEVDDAIRRGDFDALRDELGDLLFQVAYHSQMAQEAGHFDFADVVSAVCDKMVRRHPHVFGDDEVKTAEAQTRRWEEHKARERSGRAVAAGSADEDRALDGVAEALPALTRCAKLQRRAARVGFDWPETGEAVKKLEEELDELRAELRSEGGQTRLAEELGDCLFALTGVARRLGVDAEAALRDANARFERRFRRAESEVHADGRSPKEVSADEWLELWARAKAGESP